MYVCIRYFVLIQFLYILHDIKKVHTYVCTVCTDSTVRTYVLYVQMYCMYCVYCTVCAVCMYIHMHVLCVYTVSIALLYIKPTSVHCMKHPQND